MISDISISNICVIKFVIFLNSFFETISIWEFFKLKGHLDPAEITSLAFPYYISIGFPYKSSPKDVKCTVLMIN